MEGSRKSLKIRTFQMQYFAIDITQEYSSPLIIMINQGVTGALLLLVDSTAYWENLVACCYVIIHGICEPQIELSMWYPIVALIINIFVSFIMNYSEDWKLRKSCKEINDKECQKFVITKKQKNFESKKWRDLQPGDILKVQENEEFPADVLILDVSHNNSNLLDSKCYVRGGELQNGGIAIQKRSCEGTQNKTSGIAISAKLFVEQISGLVSYEYNYKGFFSGKYIHSNNPVAFDLTIENVALRGSHLVQTKAVWCLVLNVGDQCMGSIQNFKYQEKGLISNFFTEFKRKKGFNEVYYPMRMIQLSVVLLIIFVTTFFFLLLTVSSSTPQHSFMVAIVHIYDYPDQVSKILGKGYLAFVCGLMVCFPLNYRITMEAIVLMNSHFASTYHHTAINQPKFNQALTLQALGKVSNIFISKSALFHQNIFKVKQANICGKIYKDLDSSQRCDNDDGRLNSNGQSGSQTPLQHKGASTRKTLGQLNEAIKDFGDILYKQQEAQKSSSVFKKDYKYPTYQQPSKQSGLNMYPYSKPQDDQSNVSYMDASTPGHNDRKDDGEDTSDEFYIPSRIKSNPIFNNYQLYQDISNSKKKENIKEFFKCLILCHQASRRKEVGPNQQNIYKSIHSQELAQLMFAYSYGYHFIERKDKKISIEMQKSYSNLEVIYLDSFKYLDQRVTLIVVKPGSHYNIPGTVYACGPISSLYQLLDQKLNNKLLIEMKGFSQDGLNAYGYIKRDITFDVLKKIQEAVNDEHLLVKATNSRLGQNILESVGDLGFQMLGMLGIKEIFNSRDIITAQDMIRNGIRLWYMTQEDESQAVCTFNSMRLLNGESNILFIDEIDKENLENQIKDCLKSITSFDYDTQNKQIQNSQTNFHLSPAYFIASQKLGTSLSHHQLILTGQALKIILREESTLQKFLTITAYCNMIIGCDICPEQRLELLKHVKKYFKDGSYTISVIGSSEDKNLISESDVSIALHNKYQESDSLIKSDVVIESFYILSYLILQHGSICFRRLNKTTVLILYKIIFLGLMTLFYQSFDCFSASLPVKRYMFMSFMWGISFIQTFVYGVTYRDIGFEYLYRIVGEYRRNFTLTICFERYQKTALTILRGVFDVILFILPYLQRDYLTVPSLGRSISNTCFQIQGGISLFLIFTFQLLNQNETPYFTFTLILIFSLLGMLFILEDDQYLGTNQYFSCPWMLLYTLFLTMTLFLRNRGMDVMRKLFPGGERDRVRFYTEVEDRLYLEEFEHPNQEFALMQFQNDYEQVNKVISQGKMTLVNSNLMKIQRSDSMELIIEKLNEKHSYSSQSKIQSSTIFNKLTLKFIDFNKEIEYTDYIVRERRHLYRLLIFCLIPFCFVEIIKETILSSMGLIPFESFYFYLGYFFLLAFCFIALQKYPKLLPQVHSLAMFALVILYPICYYYIKELEFSLSIQILSLNFAFFTNSFVYSTVNGSALSLLILSLAYSYFTSQDLKYTDQDSDGINKYSVIIFLVVYMLCILITNIFNLYQQEKNRKLSYWSHNKNQKEFQKLEQILDVLMPELVREQTRQGQDDIEVNYSNLSIMFCDIADFDDIVAIYTPIELLRLLDSVYKEIDQLCEHFALQKIETVGKTYMACGGLKETEKKNMEMMTNKQNHIVRICQLAFEIQRVIKQRRPLKNNMRLQVKIGIHCGPLIAGVVGLIKPQFSLIGDTVNKTSRVQGKCNPGSILLSREAWAQLSENSDRYGDNQIKIELKGIGSQDAYYIYQKKHVNKDYPKLKLGAIQKDKRSGSLPTKMRTFQNNGGGDRRQNEQQNKAFNIPNNKVAPVQNQIGQRIEGAVASNLNDPNKREETSRSYIESDYSREEKEDPLKLLQMNSDSEGNEFEEDAFLAGKFNLSFNDNYDRVIQKNPTENSKYKLIERPPNLLLFTSIDPTLERQFRVKLMKMEPFRKLVLGLLFAVFQLLEIGFLSLKNSNNSKDYQFILIYPAFLLFFEGFIIFKIRFAAVETINTVSWMLTVFFILLLAGNSLQFYQVFQESRQIQVYLTQYMFTISFIYIFGGLQLGKVLIIFVVGFTLLIICISARQAQVTTKIYQIIVEVGAYELMHIFMVYYNEMLMRVLYNQDRIMEIELQKTHKLLNNLVPPPVLEGIKNNQQVVDEIEEATLLFTDMVKFTDFSNKVKNPSEVINLLRNLFSEFDTLCAENNVYKVHTIGDCYVILGFTGKIPKNERTPQIKAMEAYQVLKTGLQMINIIKKVREESENPDLKELDMRIGIHTGKIVAGIIGTEVVRYDIFGSDVLIANKMESSGLPGNVVVSEDTKRMLETIPNLDKQYVFLQQEKPVQINANIHKTQVEAFLVLRKEDFDRRLTLSELEMDDEELIENKNYYEQSEDSDDSDDSENSEEVEEESDSQHELDEDEKSSEEEMKDESEDNLSEEREQNSSISEQDQTREQNAAQNNTQNQAINQENDQQVQDVSLSQTAGFQFPQEQRDKAYSFGQKKIK